MTTTRKAVQLFAILFGFLASAVAAYAAPTAPALSPTSKNFGNVAVANIGPVQTFVVKNNQNAVLPILSITTSPEFPQTNDCGTQLAAKAQCTISVRFAPAAMGTRTATLSVRYDNTVTPVVAALSGTGTTPVSQATSLAFNNVAVGTTSIAKTVSITNNQAVPLAISSIVISGDFAQTNNCPANLAPLATCTVTITFTPTKTGSRTGALTVSHSAITTPQVTDLTGTGATTGLVSVAVTPVNPSVALGQTRQFTAIGTFSNNTTKDLTSVIIWSSASPAKATITDAGLATSVAQGTSIISANANGIVGSTTLTVGPSALVSIAVMPAAPSIPLGRTQQFTATGTYTDNTTQTLTNSVTWSSATPSTAVISAGGLATSVAVGTTTIGAALGAVSGSASLTVTPPALTSIGVAPATTSIALGTSQQFSATGTFTNGSTLDISNAVTWSSSSSITASINAAGLAQSAAVGSTTITATSGAISGLANLTVTEAALVSLAVTPVNRTIAKGLTQQFTATGTFTNQTTQDLTGTVTWASSAPTVVGMNSGGLATAVATGASTITASLSGIIGQTTMTVGAATLVSLAITPVNASTPLGTIVQLTAIATYTDGSTQDLTASASWTSSDSGVATVDAAGKAKGLALGSANIQAASGDISGSTGLTVTPAALVSIAVTPAIPSIALGRTRQFTATGTYTDDTVQDITESVTWSSSDSEVATVSMTAGTRGLATSHKAGTTTIAAAWAGVSGQTTLTITAAVVTAIDVTPAAPSLPKGTTQQLTATATYSDATTADITSSVTWNSSHANVASVSPAGLVTAVNTGSATIGAEKDGITGGTVVTVTAATLATITVAPASASIPLGTTQQFTVTGGYTDGTTQDLTGVVHWSTSLGATATISNAAGSAGLATSVAIGNVTVTAESGAVSGTASLSVTAAELVSIAVTPAGPSIPLGRSQQFTATGTYTDQSTKDITTTVTWATSDATVAVVGEQTGLAESSGVGTGTISATLGSISNSTTLTVTDPAIVSIAVTPASATRSVGETQAYAATATYTNNTTGDVTALVTWSTSASGIALINASGVASGVSSGTVTVTASSGSIQGTASLKVVALPSVSAMTVTPATITLGQSSQLTATFTGGAGVITGPDVLAPGLPISSGGSVTVTPTSVGVKSYTLTVTNEAGTATTRTVAIRVEPPGFISSFTASPTSITAGTSSTLTAVFANSTGVINPGSIPVSTGIGVPVSPTTTTIYTLTITNGAGQTTSSSLTVTVVPAPVITSFGASPAAVKQGSPSTLTGAFTGGTGSVDNGVGVVPSGFSKTIAPAASTVYTLTVTNSLGATATATASLTVFPLVSISIAPTTATIPVGSQGRFTATGTYSDNSTANLTNLVTWSSSNTAIATVNTVGLVTGTGAGTATITAALGAISGTATVTVTAVSSTAGRFVYAGNLNSTSSGYILDQTTGALTVVPGSPFSMSYPGYSIASHPSGKFVYAGGYYGVTGFSSNAITGQLTAIPGGNPFFGSAISPFNFGPFYAIAADPLGRFLFAANNSTSELFAYQVDGANGALTQVGTYATGQCARSLTVDPSGKFVYAANECGAQVGVWAYAIDADTGTLTPAPGSPIAGTAVNSVVAAPNGQVLYAISGSTIRGYSINSTTGALTLLSGFPVGTPVCCTQFSGLTIDPLGRFLYAVATGGSVSAYRVDAVTGGITAVTGSPFPLGISNTQSASIDASGKFLYVSSYANTTGSPGSVVALAINSATGALAVAAGSPFASGGSQTFSVTTTGAIVSSAATLTSIDIRPAAPTILSVGLGLRLQLTLIGHYSDGTTQQLTESATWSSSLPAKASISNSSGTKGLATSTGFGSTVITATHSGFTTTATLTVQQPALVSISVIPGATTIATGTAVQFSAVATYSDNSTQTINSSVTWSSSDATVATVSNSAGSQGLTTTVAPGATTITAALNGISGSATLSAITASASSARFVYSTNISSNTLAGHAVDQVTGALLSIAGAPVSIGGSFQPRSVTLHPSGRFAYLGTFYGVTGFATNPTTGALTQIPGSTPAFGYTGESIQVYGVAVDPTGHFAYAVNRGPSTVSAYQVDAGNGALTATATYVPAQCPASVAVDPAGKFLYVGHDCGSVAVSVYAIDAATGALSAVPGSPFGTTTVTAIAVTPNGQALYTISSNTIRAYGINATTGALTAISGFPVVTPGCCAQYGSLNVDATGRFLYAAGSGGTVSAYSINAGTGGLTGIVGSPFATGLPTTIGATSDGSGKTLYVAGYTNTTNSPGAVVALAINQTTGALSTVSGSPFATGGSQAWAVATVAAPTVSNVTLTSIEIVPAAPTISTAVLGTKLQLRLVGHYSDGSTQSLTESATWTSTLTNRATVSNTAGSKGLATSTGYGQTTITATNSGFTATATLTVQQPSVVSIALTPTAPSIAAGTAIQFGAIATYSDNSTQTVTAVATWGSSDTNVATVSNVAGSQGLAATLIAGSSTISATLNGVTGMTVLTSASVSANATRFVYVTNLGSNTLSAHAVDQASGLLSAVPGSPVSIGGSFQPRSVTLHPSGRFAYLGTFYGVTGFATNPTTGALTQIPGSSPAFGYTGESIQVYGVAVDPTGHFAYAVNRSPSTVSAYQVDAGNGALTATATYVAAQCPASVAIDPAGKFLYVGHDCGSVAVSVYAIDAATGALSAVPGSPFGTTTVTAIAVTPNGQVLYTISSNTIRAYGINATTGALTAISGFPVVTPGCCAQYGSLNVDATGRFLYAAGSGGTVSAYSINAGTGGLTGIVGSPFATGLPTTIGATSDGSGRTLYVVGYTNTANSPGAVVALAINQTTGALSTVSGSPFATGGSQAWAVATVAAPTVSNATLTSIEILPAAPTMLTATQGAKLQLRLVGHYSDGSTEFLTESASWSSGTTSVATINNSPGSKGLVTSVNFGSTIITATHSGLTATTTLAVQQPTVVSIAITPSSPTIASGTAIQFTATATYSDGTTQNVTSAATWSSADTNVATVSNVAGSRGLTTAIAPGSSTITATLNGVSGTATINVQ